MAGLSEPRTNRGQLLIITAVSLAVLLVLIALALNTAAVGEVHVAQTDDSLHEERGVVEYEDAVRRGVGGVLARVPTSAELNGSIETWRELAEIEYARGGVETSVAVTDYGTGPVVVQDDRRSFTSHDGRTRWTVAEEVSEVLVYELNVSDQNLTRTDDCASDTACFNVTAAGGTWWMTIHEQNDRMVVQVDGDTVCDANASSLPIDLVNGSIDHPDCGGGFETFHDHPDIESPYSLSYDHADAGNGTYRLAVDGSINDDERFGSGDESPRLESGVIWTDVAVGYRSTGVTYENELRITMGDRGG